MILKHRMQELRAGRRRLWRLKSGAAGEAVARLLKAHGKDQSADRDRAIAWTKVSRGSPRSVHLRAKCTKKIRHFGTENWIARIAEVLPRNKVSW
jgi:hypothetical protein